MECLQNNCHELLYLSRFQCVMVTSCRGYAIHCLIQWLMPQSRPTTGPVRFLSPVRFLARKAEWSARGNFTSVLFSWSHQATGPVRLDTAVYLWFGRLIRMTPRVPRAVPVWASYGPRTGIFNVFHIQRDPYGARAGPQGCRTAPLRTRKASDTTRIGKNPAQASYFAVRARTGPLRFPHGLLTGCLKYLNPYGACKIIMHALTLYGPRTGRQIRTAPHGARVGPVSGRTIFNQNSLWTAREQPVRGPGVWCDWGLTCCH